MDVAIVTLPLLGALIAGLGNRRVPRVVARVRPLPGLAGVILEGGG